jgi:hypothetical protein
LREKLDWHVFAAGRASLAARGNLTARDSLANAKSNGRIKPGRGKMTAK